MSEEKIIVDIKAFIYSDNVHVLLPPRLWGHKHLAKAVEAAIQATFDKPAEPAQQLTEKDGKG